MARLAEFGALKGKYWTSLDWKDIAQQILDNLLEDSDLSAFVSTETVWNGVKQFIQIGLITPKDFKKNTTLDDWNPAEPVVKQWFAKFEFQKTWSVKVPVDGLTQSFTSQAMADSFKRNVIKVLTESIKVYMFHKRIKMITTGKIELLNNRTETINYDTTLSVGNFNTDELKKSGLEKMRVHIAKYKLPSLEHTKWSRDNRASKFYTSFSPSKFVVLWNTKYYQSLGTLTATLFNKKDVLLSLPIQKDYDFQLIEGLSNAEKTALDKTLCFIIHKNALMEIMPSDKIKQTVSDPNFAVIHRMLTQWGHTRLYQYPITKVITA